MILQKDITKNCVTLLGVYNCIMQNGLDLVLEPWLKLHKKMQEQKTPSHENIDKYRDLTEMLFEELADYVFYILINRTYKAEAQDIASKTLIKVYKALPKFSGDSKAQFKSWVYKIALNTYTDNIRKKSRLKVMSFSEIFNKNKRSDDVYQENAEEYVLSTQDTILEDSVTDQEFSVLMKQLEPKERDLLLARFVYGFDYKELANMFNATESALRKRVSRIVQKLREIHENKTHRQNNDK